jgi:hypothetical protein
VLDKDVIAANLKVASRHEAQREFMQQSEEEIAAEIKRRHKREQTIKNNFYGTNGAIGDDGEIPFSMRRGHVSQQSLLPGVSDPKIFKLKVFFFSFFIFYCYCF